MTSAIAQRIWNSIGPILLSALSIFLSFLLIQPIAIFFDPSYTLLANRGLGKIAFTVLVIVHILLLLTFQTKNFLRRWFQTNVLFLKSTQWLKTFSCFFISFCFLHTLFLFICYGLGAISYVAPSVKSINSLIFKMGLGFIATFFLAWTEELIFRGTLYPFFEKTFSVFTSMFLTSFIFMLAHDLTNPFNLISRDWKLGLGLFLLGFLLNQLFVLNKNLYAGMGAHAGLVFVKVFLRRLPLVGYFDEAQWPWWFAKDLRQAHLVHILFFLIIIILLLIMSKKFFIREKELNDSL